MIQCRFFDHAGDIRPCSENTATAGQDDRPDLGIRRPPSEDIQKLLAHGQIDGVAVRRTIQGNDSYVIFPKSLEEQGGIGHWSRLSLQGK